MIKINLLGIPKAKRGKRAAAAAAASVPGEGLNPIVILLVCLVLTVVGMGAWYVMLDREATRLAAEKQAAEKKKAELAVLETKVKQKEAQRNAFEQRVKVIADLEAKRSGPVDLLSTVSETVNRTDAVWLEAMTDSGTSITLKGQAIDVHALANLMGNLKTTGYFKNVELKESFQDDKDLQAFSFVLICDKKS